MKMVFRYLYIVFFSLFLFGTLCLAENKNSYGVDLSKSKITFNAKTTIHPFDGKVDEFAGGVYAQDDSQGVRASGDLKVKTSSLATDNSALNRNMYRMLDVEKYPYAYCHVISLTAGPISPDGTAQGKVKAELTIRDKTVPFEENVMVKKAMDGFAVSGSTNISLKAFGLKPPSIFFLIKVNDEVRVDFEVLVSEKMIKSN